MARLFDTDVATRSATWFSCDEDAGTFTLHDRQDAQPILDLVAARREETPGKEFRYVGSIPMNQWQAMRLEAARRQMNRVERDRAIAAWLAENSKLMVRKP